MCHERLEQRDAQRIRLELTPHPPATSAPAAVLAGPRALSTGSQRVQTVEDAAAASPGGLASGAAWGRRGAEPAARAAPSRAGGARCGTTDAHVVERAACWQKISAEIRPALLPPLNSSFKTVLR